jgi:hypothetical protein
MSEIPLHRRMPEPGKLPELPGSRFCRNAAEEEIRTFGDSPFLTKKAAALQPPFFLPEKTTAFLQKQVLHMPKNYLFRLARLDAFSGLIFACGATVSAFTWVAILQIPLFHFRAGSGAALQYIPDSYSIRRLQPLHASTASRHLPPV